MTPTVGLSSESPLGVCSWSIDRQNASASIQPAADLGLTCIQLGYFSTRALLDVDPEAVTRHLSTAPLALVGVFVGFENEDYSSATALAGTGGLAGPAQRVQDVLFACTLAKSMGAPSVAFHVGTVPLDKACAAFAVLHERLSMLAAFAASLDLRMLLETGRESAAALLALTEAVSPRCVGVNFDPANFIMYGQDDPVRALTVLRGRMDLVHLKDAMPPAGGGFLGKRVSLGMGQTQIPRVVNKLRTTGYRGPLLLESTGGIDGVAADAAYVRTLIGS